MESKQTSVEITAVEMLIKQIEEKGDFWENSSIGSIQITINVFDYLNLIEKALEMEKQQMENVARDWWREGADYVSDVKREYVSFDKYYKMKFEKGGEK